MLVDAIASRTKVPAAKLWQIAANASRRYHEFSIQKRDGTPRIIAHPSRPLKALQRFLARNIYGLAPVHRAAAAYVKGSNIRANAAQHAGSKFTVRLDFADFFPSFDSESVKAFTKELCEQSSIPLSVEDLTFISNIVCRNGCLPIGAPSSPKITNAMMFKFDCSVERICNPMQIIYSRYADDIFLSGNDKACLNQCAQMVRLEVQAYRAPRLRLKEEKTLHLSKANHRSVTGLVLTPQGSVSIGRDRKREIKTLVHLAIEGSLNFEQRKYISGLMAFCNDVEPDFVTRLDQKFGIDVMDFIKTL